MSRLISLAENRAGDDAPGFRSSATTLTARFSTTKMARHRFMIHDHFATKGQGGVAFYTRQSLECGDLSPLFNRIDLNDVQPY